MSFAAITVRFSPSSRSGCLLPPLSEMTIHPSHIRNFSHKDTNARKLLANFLRRANAEFHFFPFHRWRPHVPL